jgi:hypothetical protein
VNRRASVLKVIGLLAAGAVVVHPAFAAGVTVTYTVTAGTPGNNGWYLSDVTAQLGVTGATNSSCPLVKTFTSSSDSLDCNATDGTSTVSFHLQFKIDKDAPVVTGASADRSPNGNGWYNAPVNVTFTGTDATSGIASCTQSTYGGPDSGGTAVSGTCTDVAGNVSAPFAFNLKYDSTPPAVSGSPARGPDANGWYRSPVAVSFGGSDSTSGVDSCTSATYGGPDSSGATVTGSCTDKAGNSAGGSFSLQYDATPPTLQAGLARPPDDNGWYNHPVALNATGTDSGSGIASCTGGTYSGPDNAAASLTATCTDNAGNTTTQRVTFKYDATPPKLTNVTVTTGNGTATLRWKATPGTAEVVVARTPGPHGGLATVYKGDKSSFTDSKLRNGSRYRYVLSATDAAGNMARAKVMAEPLALLAPLQGQKVKHPPLLRWSAIAGADYYNVQLFHGGRKVLSIWPVGTTLKLTSTWKYLGHRHTFKKGKYRWYVWPGYGPRKAAKYGKLVGGSSFIAR